MGRPVGSATCPLIRPAPFSAASGCVFKTNRRANAINKSFLSTMASGLVVGKYTLFMLETGQMGLHRPFHHRSCRKMSEEPEVHFLSVCGDLHVQQGLPSFLNGGKL